MSTLKHLIAAVLYIIAITLVFIVSVIVYQFLYEMIFKHLILANIVKN